MKNGWSSIFILILIGVLAYVFYKKFSELTFGSGGGQGLGNGGDGGGKGAGASSGNTVNVNVPGNTASAGTSEHDSGSGDSPVKKAAFPRGSFGARSKATLLPPAHQAGLEISTLIPQLIAPDLFNKMPDNKLPYDAQTQGVAKRLSAANHDAAAYQWKSGTSTKINKVLAELKTLNDVDFGKAIKAWQVLDGFNDPLDSNLGSADIENGERSNFLNRLRRLGLAN